MRRGPSTIRTALIATWLVAFTASALVNGLPTKRAGVLVWVALAIVAIGSDRPRATTRSFLTTWLPLFGALAAYDLLRGSSDSSQSLAATWPQTDIDVWLGSGTIPSARLQEWFWNPASPGWWDYAAWAVYQSHFFVPLLVAVVLWNARHPLATRYVLGLVLLSWMALATYWLYPAQPPWMVVRDGLVDGELTRVVQHMWRDVGVERAARVFTTSQADGSRYSNPVAAVPSLHAAFPMLIAVVLWGTRRWLNVVLAVYIISMGLTLVYAGEHFVFDLVLGWAYAIIAAIAVTRVRAAVPTLVEVTELPLQASASGSSGS